MRRREGMVDEEREEETVREEEDRKKRRRRRDVSDILTEGKLEQASSGRYYAASILDCSPLIPHGVWYIRLQNKKRNKTPPAVPYYKFQISRWMYSRPGNKLLHLELCPKREKISTKKLPSGGRWYAPKC